MKTRLDQAVVHAGLTPTRSQAESWIKLGHITVNGRVVKKAGQFVHGEAVLVLTAHEQYVSRAGLKLASVASKFHLNFESKIVLDVGSSTGGFTDYALQHGALKVVAIDVGTDQFHPSLRGNKRVELHEKTDIRNFSPDVVPDIVVIDVSFVSLRQILPHIRAITGPHTMIVAMVKPQFEASRSELSTSGIVKNDRVRRDILKQFELWAKQHFIVVDKSDSEVRGEHGNLERFYLLKNTTK